MPLIERRDGTCVERFNVDTEYCEQYARDLPVTTALIGDSHADHFLFAIGEALKPQGEPSPTSDSPGVLHCSTSSKSVPPTRAGWRMRRCSTSCPSVTTSRVTLRWKGRCSTATAII
jgi:hypothetical protein